MTIPEVQMTQISNMKVISLMVDFIKFIKFWHLSIEFYIWYVQKVAPHQYLNAWFWY